MKRITSTSPAGRLIAVVVAAACLAGAYYLMQSGLERLAQARQLERLPETPISALNEGPYVIAGEVDPESGTLVTPYSKTEAVYVRYRLEEEYRDSDGDRHTRTLESGERGGRFLLRDQSARVAIEPGHDLSALEWNLDRSYSRQSGRKTYSEWALAPGDTARVVGRYVPSNQQMDFSGLEAFNLPALVSGYSREADGGDRLFGAAIRISAAAGLLALGMALILTAVKVHRFWVYVVVMSVAVTGTLSTLGVTRLKAEWSSIASLYETRYQYLEQQPDNPLVLADVAALQQLIRQSTEGWLDRWMFRSQVEKRLPLPELNPETTAMAQQLVDQQHQGRYQHGWVSWGLTGGGLALALVLLFFAIRTVKFKRLAEALPTSGTRGLSFGLAELKGMVEEEESHPPMRDPLKNEKCVAYDYKVEERRGSGKKAKWVTIEHDTEQVPFWLEDNHGQALIYPEGATIEYPKHYSERRGNLRYSVKWLDTLVNVYCIGFAGLDQEQPDRLAVQQDKDSPFLISGRSEEEIILDRGAKGFVGTAISLGLFLFAATVMLAADGSFSPDNLLLSALTVPLVLFIYLAILHYNDLVFLKNRVERARANIDTILQQRHDLWPNLEKAVQASLAHEKDLLKAIGQLRSLEPPRQKSPQYVDRQIDFEQQVTSAVKARVEQYPDLKTNTVVQHFMTIMAQTENYLSLLRNSYNESTLIYNTRIQSLPDLLLAAPLRFRPAQPFGSGEDERVS